MDASNERTREQWHLDRMSGIGGSDSPVIILGEQHPFSNPLELWEEKCGISQRAETYSPALERGTVMEPIIADIYAKRTGRSVYVEPRQLRNPDYDFMVGNIDRWIVDSTHDDKGILECKCPGIRQFLKVKRQGPSDYYVIQLQHYFATSGKKWGEFAIFNADLWELITFSAERDEEFIQFLIEKDADFWHHVVTKTPPEYTPTVKTEDIPKIDIDVKFAKIDTDEWRDAVENLKMARDVSVEADAVVDDAKKRLQSIMTAGDLQIAEGAGARIYWKFAAGRKTFDLDAFKKAHPEIDTSLYMKTGASSRVFKPYFL